MDNIIELAKYILPSLVVFFTAYIIITKFINKETSRWRFELQKGNQKTITPIRLQAYERFILLLERISPESLIMRNSAAGLSAKEYKAILINTVRKEFEHNLSQQIYISERAWEATKNAKENIIKLINVAGTRMTPQMTGFDLSKLVIEMYMTAENQPISLAVEIIRTEFHDNFISI